MGTFNAGVQLKVYLSTVIRYSDPTGYGWHGDFQNGWDVKYGLFLFSHSPLSLRLVKRSPTCYRPVQQP